MEGMPTDTAKLRERIDWAYLVNIGALTTFTVMKDKEEYPAVTVENIVEFLEELIPSVYRKDDEEYNKRIKENTIKREIDIRESFGGVKMDKAIYEELGIPHTKIEDYIKPSQRFGAVIDLLNRLNALTKLDRVEIFTGEKWDHFVARMKTEIEKQEALKGGSTVAPPNPA